MPWVDLAFVADEQVSAGKMNQLSENIDHRRIYTLTIDLSIDTSVDNFLLIDDTHDYTDREVFFIWTHERGASSPPIHGYVSDITTDHVYAYKSYGGGGTEDDINSIFSRITVQAGAANNNAFMTFAYPSTNESFDLRFYARASDGALILKATASGTGTHTAKARLSFHPPLSIIEDLTGDHSWGTSEPT